MKTNSNVNRVKRVRVIRTIEYLYDITEFPKGINETELIESADKKAVSDFYKDIEEGNEMDFAQEVNFEG